MQRGARHKEGGEAEGGVFHGLLGGPNLETTIWRKIIWGMEFTVEIGVMKSHDLKYNSN